MWCNPEVSLSTWVLYSVVSPPEKSCWVVYLLLTIFHLYVTYTWTVYLTICLILVPVRAYIWSFPVFQNYLHNLQIHCIAMVFRSSNLLFTAGEFGIVYRARLTRSILRRTDCEIVAVKTIKGKDIIQPWHKLFAHMYLLPLIYCGIISKPSNLTSWQLPFQ